MVKESIMQTGYTKVLPKAGVMCFYHGSELNQILVFQINSNAEIPRLRQYLKRYASLRDTQITN